MRRNFIAVRNHANKAGEVPEMELILMDRLKECFDYRLHWQRNLIGSLFFCFEDYWEITCAA